MFVERWQEYCKKLQESENVKRYRESLEFKNYKKGMQIRGDMKLDAEIYGLLDEYTDYSKDLQDLLD